MNNFFGQPDGGAWIVILIILVMLVCLAWGVIYTLFRFVKKRFLNKGKQAAERVSDGGSSGDTGKQERQNKAKHLGGLRSDQAVDEEMARRERLRSAKPPRDEGTQDPFSGSN